MAAPGGMNAVDSAASAVLSQNPILLAAPSDMKLHEFYPTPSECTSTMAQSVNNCGQLFITSNSKTFGSSSDFQVSTANLIDGLYINVEIKPTFDNGAANKYSCFSEDGWLYNMIRSIELSYSNSNISNLILTGKALRDWNLAQVCPEKRCSRLQQAGKFQIFLQNGEQSTYKATVPISFMNWEGSGGVMTGFPLDARVLNGNVQITINWEDNIKNAVFPMRNNDAAGVALTNTQWDRCYISARTSQLMDSAFSVSHTLAMNPQAIYSLPAKWLNTYTYRKSGVVGDTISIELTSAPAGMIQGIILNIRPISVNGNDKEGLWNGTDGPYHGGSLPINYLRLQYSGQNIIYLQSQEEIRSYMQSVFGDDMEVKVNTCWTTADNSNGDRIDWSGGAADSRPSDKFGGCTQVCPIHFIPLMFNGYKVAKGKHFENLPQYSGSTLSLDFKYTNPDYYANTLPSFGGASGQAGKRGGSVISGDSVRICNYPAKKAALAAAAGFELDDASPYNEIEVKVTYVIAALLQNQNGVFELQL